MGLLGDLAGMKGDEFIIEVYKRFPAIRCMLLTGQANEDSVQNARDNANMTICVRKPWMKDDLVKAIERALNGH